MVLRETEQRQLLPQIAWLERRGATFGGCLRVRETAEHTFLYLRILLRLPACTRDTVCRPSYNFLNLHAIALRGACLTRWKR